MKENKQNVGKKKVEWKGTTRIDHENNGKENDSSL